MAIGKQLYGPNQVMPLPYPGFGAGIGRWMGGGYGLQYLADTDQL